MRETKFWVCAAHRAKREDNAAKREVGKNNGATARIQGTEWKNSKVATKLSASQDFSVDDIFFIVNIFRRSTQLRIFNNVI